MNIDKIDRKSHQNVDQGGLPPVLEAAERGEL